MPSLKTIQERVKTFTIDIDEDKMEVSIRPNRFTPAKVAEFEDAKFGTSVEGALAMCNFFCDLVASWNLKWSEDGDTVPLQPEVILESVPFPIVVAIISEIGEQMQVGKTKPGN